VSGRRTPAAGIGLSGPITVQKLLPALDVTSAAGAAATRAFLTDVFTLQQAVLEMHVRRYRKGVAPRDAGLHNLGSIFASRVASMVDTWLDLLPPGDNGYAAQSKGVSNITHSSRGIC
jgi:transaldolase